MPTQHSRPRRKTSHFALWLTFVPALCLGKQEPLPVREASWVCNGMGAKVLSLTFNGNESGSVAMLSASVYECHCGPGFRPSPNVLNVRHGLGLPEGCLFIEIVHDKGHYRALFVSRCETPVPSFGREGGIPYKLPPNGVIEVCSGVNHGTPTADVARRLPPTTCSSRTK